MYIIIIMYRLVPLGLNGLSLNVPVNMSIVQWFSAL